MDPEQRPRPAAGDFIRSSQKDIIWSRHEVKTLRRVLKDVPTCPDKNARFKRVSDLMRGDRTKKECHDKYKELKAEAKAKARRASQAVEKAKYLSTPVIISGGKYLRAPCSPSEGIGRGSRGAKGASVDSTRGPSGRATASAGSWCDKRGSGAGEEDNCTSNEGAAVASTSCGSISTSLSGSCWSNRGSSGSSGLTAASGESSAARRESRRGEVMEVEEIEEIEDEEFCLDDNLEHVAQTNRRQACGQGGWNHARTTGHSTHYTDRENSVRQTSAIGDGSGGGCKSGTERAVTEDEAIGAREIIFGDSLKCFNDAWKKQGFYFCGVDGLRYGLVQAEGGPCGVLAVVQAFLLESLIIGGTQDHDWSNPSKSRREYSLASALSTIIWRAGDGCTATLAVVGGGCSFRRSSCYRPDGVTERLRLYRAGEKKVLESLVREKIRQFTTQEGSGVVLLVYSCLFTRGLAAARGDMDKSLGEPPTMMARHGYASQEMVNLLLLGRAHSNVFDGQRVISDDNDGDSERLARGRGKGGDGDESEGWSGGDAGDRYILTGASSRGRVGFLTLFEAYKYVEVGDRLKNPETPIWVVSSESHYSVLFNPDPSIASWSTNTNGRGAATASSSTTDNDRGMRGKYLQSSKTARSGQQDGCIPTGPTGNADLRCDRPGPRARDGKAREMLSAVPQEPFDLHYFDGLSRQDEVIRLTVDERPDACHTPLPTADDAAGGALVPPLDLVIRTKWPGAYVDWNTTDPIL